VTIVHSGSVALGPHARVVACVPGDRRTLVRIATSISMVSSVCARIVGLVDCAKNTGFDPRPLRMLATRVMLCYLLLSAFVFVIGPVGMQSVQSALPRILRAI